MKDPKKHLIDRILSFRKQKRIYPGVMPLNARSDNKHYENNSPSAKKGSEFEAFVVSRFDPELFTLIEWRSDKNTDGIFPLMSKFPDLEFYFESKSENKLFAIECKWRENFLEGKIILNKFHIENYKHYEAVTGNLTFIVIGVGNTPSSPNQVYIIPLKDIDNNILHEFNMGVYRRANPGGMFFLNCASNTLK
jgi:hypothetical protein